jgi:hypothetical protein
MTRKGQFSTQSLNEILIYISFAPESEESLKIVDELERLCKKIGTG